MSYSVMQLFFRNDEADADDEDKDEDEDEDAADIDNMA